MGQDSWLNVGTMATTEEVRVAGLRDDTVGEGASGVRVIYI